MPEAKDLLQRPEIFETLSLDSQYLAVIVVANYFEAEKKVKMEQVLRFTDVASEVQQEFAILFMLALKQKRRQFFTSIMRRKDSPTWKALVAAGYYLGITNKST